MTIVQLAKVAMPVLLEGVLKSKAEKSVRGSDGIRKRES
jgi:hypothetical protein